MNAPPTSKSPQDAIKVTGSPKTAAEKPVADGAGSEIAATLPAEFFKVPVACSRNWAIRLQSAPNRICGLVTVGLPEHGRVGRRLAQVSAPEHEAAREYPCQTDASFVLQVAARRQRNAR